MPTLHEPPFSNPATNASYDSLGVVSVVSDTVEDQPGPGRRLGQLTRWVGRKLECAAGRVIAVLLPTPEALTRRIKALLDANVMLLAYEKKKEEWKVNVELACR